MATDINRVVLVGRLTRDAEQSYTQSGFALLKFGIAVNRSRKQGDQWVEEANFFDVTVFGRQGEAIASYMTKGKQVAVEGQLRQDRWEAQDGSKRSKVIIEASNIQLLGSRDGAAHVEPKDDSWNEGPPQTGGNRPAATGSRPQGFGSSGFEDDIPF